MPSNPEPVIVAALYRFVRLANHAELQQPLRERMEAAGVRGTLLLANEGINGTIAGPPSGIDSVLGYLNADPRLFPLEVKFSTADKLPFKRARVRLKKEIVTLGIEGIDPNDCVGTYVEPEQWNELIADPEVVVIDTRNAYEVSIGSFEGALNPHTESFREFPDFVARQLDPAVNKKVAMYCTGGIRCEKSTSLLKMRGFAEVYHLRGGILRYLERVPEAESKWRGECFVFDERVSVGHGLAVGNQVMCYACGWPVPEADQKHEDYRPGVQCPRCAATLSDDQKKRFAERQRQIDQSRSMRQEPSL